MLNKIYYRSNKEVVLIFTHRSPVALWSSDGKVLELMDEFLAPLHSECATLSEWNRRVQSGQEDTQVINLDEVA